MGFYSILFPSPEAEECAQQHPWLDVRAKPADEGWTEPFPVLFEDLHLDQVVDSILFRDADRDLKAVFTQFCPDAHTIQYRQEILRALENADCLDLFEGFCRSIEESGRCMDCAQKVHHPAQRAKYALDGAALYFEAIQSLLDRASGRAMPAQGLAEFLNAVQAHSKTPEYARLEARIRQAKASVEGISYALRIREGRVLLDFDVQKSDCVSDLEEDLQALMGNTLPEQAARPRIRLFGQLELCPLEARIVDVLERRYAGIFDELRRAATAAAVLPAPFIAHFVREVRFYTRYRAFMQGGQEKGMPFAYPALRSDDEVRIDGAYDLALALKAEGVVANDLSLASGERGAFITGANQAGKTTFLRAIGQIAVLAALGLAVPCRSATLPLFRRIFSHFTQIEDASTDHGKLKEELLRLRPILYQAGADSLVLLNELFSSTTAQDALEMADQTLTRLTEAGARVLCVTHIQGLAPKRMVSMAPQIDPVSHERLYRIVRAPAETHAYADEIARKYRLTHPEIKERIEHGN